MSERLSHCFGTLKSQGKTALIPFIMAGDPNLQTCEVLLGKLPDAGADIIEIGMPFSDPTADGPTIQEAGLRALKAGIKLAHILEMVMRFRGQHPQTPIILMGYYNPLLAYGVERFVQDACQAGVDGLIIVDLPPEEAQDLEQAIGNKLLDIIRLVAPTTDEERLSVLLKSASGFVYTIAIKGITGTDSADQDALNQRVLAIKKQTDLPVVAGFGIRTAEQAAALKGVADGVVVGSAFIDALQEGEDNAISLIQHIASVLKS